jgi:hypothetical protein
MLFMIVGQVILNLITANTSFVTVIYFENSKPFLKEVSNGHNPSKNIFFELYELQKQDKNRKVTKEQYQLKENLIKTELEKINK